MTTLEILTRARALIERPEAWTRGAAARDASGNGCALAADACAWCAFGAIEAAGGKSLDARDEARQLLGFGLIRDLALWNDAPERTHAEVLAAFDRAIEMARRGA